MVVAAGLSGVAGFLVFVGVVSCLLATNPQFSPRTIKDARANMADRYARHPLAGKIILALGILEDWANLEARRKWFLLQGLDGQDGEQLQETVGSASTMAGP